MNHTLDDPAVAVTVCRRHTVSSLKLFLEQCYLTARGEGTWLCGLHLEHTIHTLTTSMDLEMKSHYEKVKLHEFMFMCKVHFNSREGDCGLFWPNLTRGNDLVHTARVQYNSACPPSPGAVSLWRAVGVLWPASWGPRSPHCRRC